MAERRSEGDMGWLPQAHAARGSSTSAHLHEAWKWRMADREGSQFVSQCVIHFANPPVFVLPHIFHGHCCKTNLRVAFHSFVPRSRATSKMALERQDYPAMLVSRLRRLNDARRAAALSN